MLWIDNKSTSDLKSDNEMVNPIADSAATTVATNEAND
jgi:hypothetical protein